MSFLSVHTSFSNRRDAAAFSRILIKERLAACANIIPARSLYRWEGKIEAEDEVMVVLKTDEGIYPRLEERLKDLHPYQVPMIVATTIRDGSKDYLAWLKDSLSKEE